MGLLELGRHREIWPLSQSVAVDQFKIKREE